MLFMCNATMLLKGASLELREIHPGSSLLVQQLTVSAIIDHRLVPSSACYCSATNAIHGVYRRVRTEEKETLKGGLRC
jgi:hypothetical protein